MAFNEQTAHHVYLNKTDKKLLISPIRITSENMRYLMNSDGGGNTYLSLEFAKMFCLGYINAQTGEKITNDMSEFK